MKKYLRIITFFTIIIFSNLCYVYGNNEIANISAEGVYLIDNKTNKVLYSKNENKKLYPASTTKILTAILTIENTNLDEKVSASYDSVMSIGEGYSSANINVEEELTVEQLLQVLIVHSANDAANVLAEHVGGSIDSFVSMMNTKLHELGLENSHFTNTYGKHDPNHYTTAHDLAFLFKYCMKNDTFRKIAGSASCAIPKTNKSANRLYKSTNELLNPNSSNYYPFLTAGKTGYTSQAKECLVSSAYKNDMELICVTLGSSNRFSDTKNLYDYAFSNYELKNISNENDIAMQIEVSNATRNTKDLDLLVKETIHALVKINEELDIKTNVNLNDNITAPISENDIIGTITYEVNGISYTTDLLASHSVEKSKMIQYVFYVSLVIFIIIFIHTILYIKKRKR